ncbi:hypothetical protein K402DRAFT_449044 [Aulographum hederae CBS 113979]|uniref:Uncharacterized protein n=1 Tax=Aulographum hederae CBS 113979 TaxID=1176131 RepID=A0A6G1GLB1_9PEZI|nr:hypothetical protein K402DRAFT_449044 [Aulographum hederae CBS 113979]
MHDEHPHHLLAQLPLTVSPYLSLPTSTTLPYTYKTLPSTIPPSILDLPQSQSQNQPQTQPDDPEPPLPAYIQSTTSAHSAHPTQIIASCRALQAHLQKLETDAKDMVRAFEEGIRERELAEKRRVAPGWLDVGEGGRGLVPERKGGGGDAGSVGGVAEMGVASPRMEGGGDAADVGDGRGGGDGGDDKGGNREGEELDRAFGGLGIGSL